MFGGDGVRGKGWRVMKAIIHYDGDYADVITVYADTMEELKENALHETDFRGWERKDCWSEIDGEEEKL